MTFTSQTFETNGQSIHAKVLGPDDAPVMIMLHGFPEYWFAWAEIAPAFSKDYRIILPDQRGFNLSSKPEGVENYDMKHLVADLHGIVEQVSPGAPFMLCGHDWGASVAYAYAMRHGDRVKKLVIANGVHPICFQKALLAGGAQTDASQYIRTLRDKTNEPALAANDFARVVAMFEKFSSAPWLDKHELEGYLTAWRHPGAFTNMINWYRASPLEVPLSGTPGKDLEITDDMRSKYRITMPHLLLWGTRDQALLESCYADLDQFCDDLTIHKNDDGSHWLLHEVQDWVIDEIKTFLAN